MIGAIIGDVVGSRFEFAPIKTTEFELFDETSKVTDDSVMTLAVAEAIMAADGDKTLLEHLVVEHMQEVGKMYLDAGYGQLFMNWLKSYDPKPYESYGNGGAMRVSPAGFAAKSIEEAKELANIVTRVTHNSEEGLKGAEAVAVCIYLAKSGEGKDDIRDYLNEHYYDMDFSLDEIRDSYTYHVDALGSVPQAIECFLEADNFEDAVRNAVSLGGDADTMADIAGAIAEAYYGVPNLMRGAVVNMLDEYMLDVLHNFESKYGVYREA